MLLALFAGDSITATAYTTAGVTNVSGVYADLICERLYWTRGGTAGAYPCAVPGATLSNRYPSNPLNGLNGLDNFAARVASVQPDALFTLWGANDAQLIGSNDTNLDTYDAAWDSWWNLTLALPKRPLVYVLGLPCITAPLIAPPRWSYNDRWLHRELDCIAQRHARLNGGEFIPLDTCTDAGMTRDGTHPSMRGHYAIAGSVLDYLGVK